MKVGVVIGRFNPPHIGHIELINNSIKNNNLTIVCIGSHKSAISSRNLFNTLEISNIFKSYYNGSNIEFANIEDNLYSDTLWTISVKNKVNAIAKKHSPTYQITLYGHLKDNSSEYLKWFNDWNNVNVEAIEDEDEKVYHATDFRKMLLSNNLYSVDDDKYYDLVIDYFTKGDLKLKSAIKSELNNKITKGELEWLKQEFNYYEDYKQKFSMLPYPPIFVTVDACVICNQHILLIERKNSPGKGLLALPGGFIDHTETIVNGIMRELAEETKIDVPIGKLKNSLVDITVYDAPHRSLRGRTITHAGCFILNESKLPKVKAADDAANVFWMPLSKVISNQNLFFEDHYHIISDNVRKFAE